ncbi:hypothetical protein F5Y18DRAFT_190902 [Xylariaceae sp. FL1019]|nr:hypothetical protein F5Y18DRAFT_190902 [Xylariaceae sp. FL1019]
MVCPRYLLITMRSLANSKASASTTIRVTYVSSAATRDDTINKRNKHRIARTTYHRITYHSYLRIVLQQSRRIDTSTQAHLDSHGSAISSYHSAIPPAQTRAHPEHIESRGMKYVQYESYVLIYKESRQGVSFMTCEARKAMIPHAKRGSPLVLPCPLPVSNAYSRYDVFLCLLLWDILCHVSSLAVCVYAMPRLYWASMH